MNFLTGIKLMRQSVNTIFKIIIVMESVIILAACSSSENVTLRKYEVVEHLRGQPAEIYVRTADSKLYLFSHSNYYIQNDTLYGRGYLMTDEDEIIFEGEFVLTNIESIQYNYEIEQDLEVYYDPEKDSVVGHKYAGAKTYIEMNDGTDYTGELLAVRESTMILCDDYEADEQDLVDSVYSIYVLNNYDIKLIEIKVGNYALTGILVGCFAGAIAGGVSYSDPPQSKGSKGSGYGALGGSIVGIIIGWIIGANITDYEPVYEYVSPEEYDFKQLKIYARYVNNEPEFLKKIK